HRARKIHVVNKCLVVAGTGHVGMSQRFQETAGRTWNDVAGKGKSPMDICRALAGAFVADCQSTGMKTPELGALVGFPNKKGGPQLCEFQTSNFQPELKDTGTWFVSMGSGQLIADSYLAFG